MNIDFEKLNDDCHSGNASEELLAYICSKLDESLDKKRQSVVFTFKYIQIEEVPEQDFPVLSVVSVTDNGRYRYFGHKYATSLSDWPNIHMSIMALLPQGEYLWERNVGLKQVPRTFDD